MTRDLAADAPRSARETSEALRQFLVLDRTLAPSDRKVLERLLLDPSPATVRELARGTGTNVQSLYVALERLERRGLILRERTGPGMTFRAGHPSAVIQELMGSWREASELARKVEEPLRRLHEERRAAPAASVSDRMFVTPSLTACLGSMLHRLRSVRSEVWVVADESVWWTSSRALERELLAVAQSAPAPTVRLLVREPEPDSDRRAALHRLRAGGVAVRFSELFSAPMVLLDRRTLYTRMAPEPEGLASGAFLRLEAPELVADLSRQCSVTWPKRPAMTVPRSTEEIAVGADDVPGIEVRGTDAGRSWA